MASITDQKHRRAVANYLAGKVREFRYQLNVIVTACDQALLVFRSGEGGNDDAILAYGFSAFTNAMQSLKDAVKIIGGPSLTWPDIGQLAYGDFMSKARNAATHDGNPIVNAWVDGKYFVAQNIHRFYMNSKPIKIIRPEADIRTICLEFAAGFSDILCDRLTPMLGQFQIGGTPIDRLEFHAIINDATLIPEDVKQMVWANLEDISQAIEKAPSFDPVEKAITELKVLAAYCVQSLNAAGRRQST